MQDFIESIGKNLREAAHLWPLWGFNPDGSQWIAPTNWVNGPLPLDKIVDIRYMEKIVTEVDEAEFPVAVLGERPVVEIDLCFSVIDQGVIDLAYREVLQQFKQNRMGVDILIKRVPTTIGPPRLICDYGQIYEALVDVLQMSKNAEITEHISIKEG